MIKIPAPMDMVKAMVNGQGTSNWAKYKSDVT